LTSSSTSTSTSSRSATSTSSSSSTSTSTFTTTSTTTASQTTSSSPEPTILATNKAYFDSSAVQAALRSSFPTTTGCNYGQIAASSVRSTVPSPTGVSAFHATKVELLLELTSDVPGDRDNISDYLGGAVHGTTAPHDPAAQRLGACAAAAVPQSPARLTLSSLRPLLLCCSFGTPLLVGSVSGLVAVDFTPTWVSIDVGGSGWSVLNPGQSYWVGLLPTALTNSFTNDGVQWQAFPNNLLNTVTVNPQSTITAGTLAFTMAAVFQSFCNSAADVAAIDDLQFWRTSPSAGVRNDKSNRYGLQVWGTPVYGPTSPSPTQTLTADGHVHVHVRLHEHLDAHGDGHGHLHLRLHEHVVLDEHVHVRVDEHGQLRLHEHGHSHCDGHVVVLVHVHVDHLGHVHGHVDADDVCHRRALVPRRTTTPSSASQVSPRAPALRSRPAPSSRALPSAASASLRRRRLASRRSGSRASTCCWRTTQGLQTLGCAPTSPTSTSRSTATTA